MNEDVKIDIITVEKDTAFSDSDASQDELCFLPTIPSPDIPEQEDKYLMNSLKLDDCTQSSSPFSDEAGLTVNGIIPGPRPISGNISQPSFSSSFVTQSITQ